MTKWPTRTSSTNLCPSTWCLQAKHCLGHEVTIAAQRLEGDPNPEKVLTEARQLEAPGV
jgi:hypothetical protein